MEGQMLCLRRKMPIRSEIRWKALTKAHTILYDDVARRVKISAEVANRCFLTRPVGNIMYSCGRGQGYNYQNRAS